jgi:hypothetical protein
LLIEIVSGLSIYLSHLFHFSLLIAAWGPPFFALVVLAISSGPFACGAAIFLATREQTLPHSSHSLIIHYTEQSLQLLSCLVVPCSVCTLATLVRVFGIICFWLGIICVLSEVLVPIHGRGSSSFIGLNIVGRK